jgi:hypothetical protein
MTSLNKPPLSQTLERLAQLRARKAQPKLDPALELFATTGTDIYQKRNEEEE